jgi:hypothetical protein
LNQIVVPAGIPMLLNAPDEACEIPAAAVSITGAVSGSASLHA